MKRQLLIELDRHTDDYLRGLAANDGAGYRDWMNQKATELLEREGEALPGSETIVDKRAGRDIAITLELDEGYLFIAEKKAAEQGIRRNDYVSGLLREYAMDMAMGGAV